MNEILKTEYFLSPGYMIFPREPMVIYMVLGSCVAVILYDREVKKSACCHYILPRMPEDTSPMPIYGTVAVLGLIRLFLEDGTLIENLEAQVIGGSDLPGRSVGRENVEIAMKILAKKDVHITSSDVGGEKGRKVIYNSESNHLAVIKVEKIRAEDWYPDEGNT